MENGILSINGSRVEHIEIVDFVAPTGGDVQCIVVPRVVDQRTVTESGRIGMCTDDDFPLAAPDHDRHIPTVG